MRNTIFGLSLGVLAAVGCSGPTSGQASLGFDPTLPGGPVAGLQFGTIGSALAYTGDWLLQLPDGGLQDAGPGVSIEMYNSGPGVACYAPFDGITPYIADAGPAAGNNASIYPSVGQWATWINFGGFPTTGLAAVKVPLVPQAVAVGTTALGATLTVEQIDGSEITSVSGEIDISSSTTSGVTATINGLGNNLPVLAGAQPADIAAVFAAGLDDPQFDADADAGAPQSVLYQDALNDAEDAGAAGAPLAAALLADPDAGGTFLLQGGFTAPVCNSASVPNP